MATSLPFKRPQVLNMDNSMQAKRNSGLKPQAINSDKTLQAQRSSGLT